MTTGYKKTVRLGTISGDGWGYSARSRLSVDVEVEIRDNNGEPELSICGNIWKPHKGDILCGGQCYEEIADAFPNNPKVQRIVEIWKRWHLNDMRAGCEHQRSEGWAERPIDPSKPLDSYGTHFEGQRQSSWNMLAWVRPDEHPEGLLGAPCPVCGYRYGSEWLHEELPAAIIDEVRTW